LKKIIKFLTINNLKKLIPFLLVVLTALAVALTNIKWGVFYSGWDNVHPEFDLFDYARQVFFGAWSEHQGLGSPSAQGQLAEIFRLPIVFFLMLFVPVANIRLVFIFLMFLVGGIGMYLYLSKAWLSKKKDGLKSWLASLGAIFYLLHILTLQQFYISFEMFMVQFAFFPFLLLCIHSLINEFSAKNIFYFLLLQFLIAPSAHTQTVFYLAVLFSLIYSFFLTLQNNNLFEAIRKSFLIGFITFFANSYWILPNVYYSLHNAHYVQESRDNQLFAPESVWSVREAGTIENLTSGTHYLFSWKDYSFEDGKHELIFNEWQDHLSLPVVSTSMKVLGFITLIGFIFVIFSKDKKTKRWGILLIYIFSFVFIWIDLLPTNKILDELYKSETFREAFRNPFTKLSILYSFVSIILFITVIEKITLFFENKKIIKFINYLVFLSLFSVIFLISWPSFKGHFISEKLQVEYPNQYWEMFDYLKTRDKDLRILQLPQFTHAGWEYYDWQFLKEGNGYQGMGFYFFGFPQAFLNRDSDRWVETSDFFYYELKHALDSYDEEKFSKIVDKYEVDLVIVDETRFDPARKHNFFFDYNLLKVGFKKVWQKDFLTVYERNAEGKENEILVPKTLRFVKAETSRVRTDYPFVFEDDYVLDDSEFDVIYPFSYLMTHRPENVIFEDQSSKFWNEFDKNNYELIIPEYVGEKYFVPAAIKYENDRVTVDFPRFSIITEEERIDLSHLESFEFKVDNEEYDIEELVVFFNDFGVIVKNGETTYPILEAAIGEEIRIEYSAKPAEIEYSDDDVASSLSFDSVEVITFDPNWKKLTEEIRVKTETGAIGFVSSFPTIKVDLDQNPSVNCLENDQGEIRTVASDGRVIYEAKDWAVNCNGYTFKDVSSSYSYVMRIKGKNFQGRTTKFFVNYGNSMILPEDYLEQREDFDLFITLGQVTTDSRETFFLNWETRSFGKESINELNAIELQPVPLNRLAQIRLVKNNEVFVNDGIEIENDTKKLESVFEIDYDCQLEKCYLGIDQTYDDLWVGFDKNNGKFLKHLRLNNWANLWEVNKGEGRLIVVYFPEIVSLVSLGLVSITFISLGLSLFISEKDHKSDEELAE
jgi:hypothetical protein